MKAFLVACLSLVLAWGFVPASAHAESDVDGANIVETLPDEGEPSDDMEIDTVEDPAVVSENDGDSVIGEEDDAVSEEQEQEGAKLQDLRNESDELLVVQDDDVRKGSSLTSGATDSGESITSIVSPGKQAYTGRPLTPRPVVKCGSKTLTYGTDYSLSYKANTEVGTATVTAKGKGNYQGTKSTTFQIVAPSVGYRVHCQTYGWETGYSWNGKVSGTTGESKRLEAVRIKLGSGFPVVGGIKYRTHVQTYGWQGWVSDGALSGTTGQSKRLEAIQIKLTGAMAGKYDVYYRVHAQRLGWMGWAKNGKCAGTSGLSWRLEAIQVVLVPKGGAAPSELEGIKSDKSIAYLKGPQISYRACSQGYGWQAWGNNGATAGMAGASTCLEALEVSLASGSLNGGVAYRVRTQGAGWQGWCQDGSSAWAEGTPREIEAIQIKLTGRVSSYFDVWYRVYVDTIGWMAWAKNGESAGTLGLGLRAEAYQIKLAYKGSNPSLPAGDYRGAAVNAYVPKPANMSIKLVPELAHGYKSPYYQRCIVMHDTTENRGFDYWIYDWIRRGGSGTQFMVNEAGEIRQYVDMNQICWHAGGATYDYINQMFNVVQHTPGAGSAMNQCSIGIEIDHIEDGRPYPAAQLDAIDRLVAYIDAYYGYECTILQHKDYHLSNSDCSDEFQGYLQHLKEYRTTR